MLRMRTEKQIFNYEQPEMIYDKKTGDVIIIDKNANLPKKKIINNFDDLEKERQKLMKEVDDKKDLSEADKVI